MADNIDVTPGSGATVSAVEITTLNGGTVPAQKIQRVTPAFRTGAATAVDYPGDAANGLDVDVTRLPQLPAGTNVIGDVGPSLRATSNGLTSSRVNAAGSTNATSLKASAGRIGQIDLFNVATSTRYFKLYNKASAPTVGTDTPVWTIPIPATSGFSVGFPFGKYFSTGIAYAITGAQADSDTTAITALDVTGSIDWV